MTSHPESQVRHLVAVNNGVWVSVRLESTLRLLHAETGQPLQEVELGPCISRILGERFGGQELQLSLMMWDQELWGSELRGISVFGVGEVKPVWGGGCSGSDGSHTFLLATRILFCCTPLSTGQKQSSNFSLFNGLRDTQDS